MYFLVVSPIYLSFYSKSRTKAIVAIRKDDKPILFQNLKSRVGQWVWFQLGRKVFFREAFAF